MKDEKPQADAVGVGVVLSKTTDILSISLKASRFEVAWCAPPSLPPPSRAPRLLPPSSREPTPRIRIRSSAKYRWARPLEQRGTPFPLLVPNTLLLEPGTGRAPPSPKRPLCMGAALESSGRRRWHARK
ncbi:hypothetical protein K438DRAFT_1981499 [Mycena galopus ATCC 62051]|nr:hypothetical protein K438DRAFT_1981499 [Mycena galopus ATCC 62051]